MTLANVAWVLASRGKRVLVIDWDLEAPGLHRYFRPFLADEELTQTEGLIDFVTELALAASNPNLHKQRNTPSETRDLLRPYLNLLRYAVPLDWSHFLPPGRIDFVPAGRQGASYATRVNTFDWQHFYSRLQGGSFLESVKERLRPDYDYILIDSRTGVSDTSGICTVQMPDALAVCFTLNHQSIDGAAAVAASARAQWQGLSPEDSVSTKQGPAAESSLLKIFPIPMRVDDAEERRRKRQTSYARRKFDPLLENWDSTERERYWQTIEFRYMPLYAYEEVLAYFHDQPRHINSMLAAVERLTAFLTGTPEFESHPPPKEEGQRALAAFLGPATEAEKILEQIRQNARIDSSLVGLVSPTSVGERPASPPFLYLDLVIEYEQTLRGTQERQEQARRSYVSLARVLAETPYCALVLLGPPGSGKSHLLSHLETELAMSPQLNAAATGFMVPFRVSLRYFLPGQEPLDWLRKAWNSRHRASTDFDEILRSGRLLLLLDGLNEMPCDDSSQYRRQVQTWRHFLQGILAEQSSNRAVFTCRTLSYTALLSAPRLLVPHVRILPLDDEKMREFLCIYRAEAVDTLMENLRRSPLKDLYRRPFFLRLLVHVQQAGSAGEASQVEGRVILLTSFIHHALRREIERNSDFVPPALLTDKDHLELLSASPETPFHLPDDGHLIPGLSRLAAGMLSGPGGHIHISHQEALRLLNDQEGEAILAAGRAIGVLQDDARLPPAAETTGIRKDVGASEQLGDSVSFHTPMVQDYFAARWLARHPDPSHVRAPWRRREVRPSIEEAIASLPLDSSPLPLLPSPSWSEATVLASVLSSQPDAFIRQLIPENLVVAGRCAAQPEGKVSEHLKAEVRRALLERMGEAEADLRARFGAGLVIGRLGHPEFSLQEGASGPYLQPPIITIPAGRYTIGTEDGEPWLAPSHKVDIAAFGIGKYPVTNAEWRHFMDAGGYQNEEWWPTEGARSWQSGAPSLREAEKESFRMWYQRLQRNPTELRESYYKLGRLEEGMFEQWEVRRRLSEQEFEEGLDRFITGGAKSRPAQWRDDQRNGLSQPVVGISWYEGLAYCNWLSHQTGHRYRLPTEVEWEAAARGPEGRRYPYGDELEHYKFNFLELRLLRPAPIGVFPGSETPLGVADLCGNIWEWTTSLWGASPEEPSYKYPYNPDDGRESIDAPPRDLRVVRGASYKCVPRLTPASYRAWYDPLDRFDFLGLRLVRQER